MTHSQKDIVSQHGKLKVLCICEHGNVRSVALAYLLKTIYGHDALACGVRETSYETKKLLFDWADKIIILIPIDVKITSPKAKSIYFDIGDDVWHDPFAHGLQHRLLKGLKKLRL